MIDFDTIRRDYALPDIASQSGVALERNGREFKALCCFHADKNPSLSFYQGADKCWHFMCFSCGAKGDNIDFVQERYGVTKREAAEIITGTEQRQPVAPARSVDVVDPYEGLVIGRPTADAPAIVAHKRTPEIFNPKRNRVVSYTPSAVYPYTDRNGALLGYVLRIEFDDKKITPGVWWTAGNGREGWAHGSYGTPRPLYRLKALYDAPTAQVLLVEGEKCADAAAEALAGMNVVSTTWIGGGQNISKTYWKSLAGRTVVIWRDNDAACIRTMMGHARPGGHWTPGLVDMLYAAGVALVKIVDIVGDWHKGWDIADALWGSKKFPETTTMTPAEIKAYIRSNVSEWSLARFNAWKQSQLDEGLPSSKESQSAGNFIPDEPPLAADSDPDRNSTVMPRHAVRDDSVSMVVREAATVGSGSQFEVTAYNWREKLQYTEKGTLCKSSMLNVNLSTQYDPMFMGLFAWNSFNKLIYLLRCPEWDYDRVQWKPRPLVDEDITSARSYMEFIGMAPKQVDMQKAIVRVAKHAKFNPVTSSMDRLKWDGVPRLFGGAGSENKGWAATYLGADDSPATTSMAARWLISAVARSYDPGCKVDTMIILEGPQGLRKSTALETLANALGPNLFTDEISDPNSKDAGMQMQGVLIIEMSELANIGKSNVESIKAWISRKDDRFRPPYGMTVDDYPRSCVFAGTCNPHDKIGYLKDQTGGRRFWPIMCGPIDIPALQRDAPQLWAEAIHLYRQGEQWWLTAQEEEWAFGVQESRVEIDPWWEDVERFLIGLYEVSLSELMVTLQIATERRNAAVTKRINGIMHSMGWTSEKIGQRLIFKRPSLV